MDKDRIKMARALRGLVIDATEEELRADFEERGEDFEALASRGRAVAERALGNAAKHSAVIFDLHRGLGALICMLRRRDQLSPEELVRAATIDISELRAIESDPKWDPHPRTIYQLEQYFKLPARSLVVLSGAKRVEGGIREEAVRFAANSKTINKLSREEKNALSDFVRFLGEQTDR